MRRSATPKTLGVFGVAQVDGLSSACAGKGHGWLFPRTAKHSPARASVRAVIESFAEPGKAQAFENLVYLQVTDQSDSDEPTPGKEAAE